MLPFLPKRKFHRIRIECSHGSSMSIVHNRHTYSLPFILSAWMMSQYLLHFSRLFHLCSFILFFVYISFPPRLTACALRIWLGSLMYSSSSLGETCSPELRHCGWPQRDSRIWWQRTTTNIFFMSRSFLMCGHKLCWCASIRRYGGFSSSSFFLFSRKRARRTTASWLFSAVLPFMPHILEWLVYNKQPMPKGMISLFLSYSACVCVCVLRAAFGIRIRIKFQKWKKRWIFYLAARGTAHPATPSKRLPVKCWKPQRNGYMNDDGMFVSKYAIVVLYSCGWWLLSFVRWTPRAETVIAHSFNDAYLFIHINWMIISF